ncbi:MAG: GNAT family N-acetyltransferase [Ktedonobacteraceae bacterium]
MNIVMQPMTLEDVASIDPLLIQAYNANSSFQDELEYYLRLQPDGWFFALDHTTPVGMGGVMNYGSFAYIGLIAVAPTMQRRGVGKLIMEHLLHWLAEQGCLGARLVATSSGAGLYSKLGFIQDDTTVAYRQEEQEGHALEIRQEAGGEQISLLHADDLEILVAFDAPIFGANRRRVLASYLAELPGRCMATRDKDDNITGYLVAQHDALGPWIARTPTEAEALLVHALALPFKQTPAVRVNTSHPVVVQMLTKYGFTERRIWKHMYHGSREPLQQKEHLYALASSAIG